MNRVITTGCYGIVVEFIDGGGTITSNLREVCPICGASNCYQGCSDEFGKVEDEDGMEERLDFNKKMDALESIILALAIAGIDITTPAYLEGIETAVEACSNNT